MPTPTYTSPSTGWLCPVCGAVYAPWVASCLQCPKPKAPVVGSTVTTWASVCPVCLGSTAHPPSQGCRCDEYHAASHT